MPRYAVYRDSPGSTTTFNGRCIDALHEFADEDERDAFMRWLGEDNRHYRRVTVAEARKLAREIYNRPLSKLCRMGDYGMGGTPSEMMPDPEYQ